MLKDDLQELKKEHPAGLTIQMGGCRFCGQVRQIETLISWSEENCNEAATELCDCFEATYYTRKKGQKERSYKAINEQFGSAAGEDQVNEAAVHLLHSVTDLIVESKIESAAIDIGGGFKAKISTTAKGTVKISKTKTEKEEQET